MRVSVARSTRLQRAPESGAAALGVEAERGGVAIDVPDVAPAGRVAGRRSLDGPHLRRVVGRLAGILDAVPVLSA